MNIDDCFEKRLLKRGRPDRLKSAKALDMAAKALDQAEKLREHEFYEQTILYSYTSMFQASRALLFKDGIFEKSHYCVIEYLKQHYVKSGILDQIHIYWLDTYRIERHETLYGLNHIEIREYDASTAIESARTFLETIRKLI
jgi:uncharacterized protein (UPF0332 family)